MCDVTDPTADAGPQFTRRRSLAYATVLVLGFFGLLEVGLRMVGVRAPPRPRLILRAIDEDIDFPFMRPDPELLWMPRPGWRGEFLGQAVAINTLGLRGAEVARPKPTTRRRVICFGDSITFGYGVSDGQTYPARLQERLADRGFEVVNGGVTGYTSHQVGILLERVLPLVQPDLATFCVGWNDGTLRPLSDREYAGRVRTAMAVEGVLDRLYVFRAARGLYTRSALPAAAPPALKPRVEPLVYAENLRAMVARCRGARATPVFLALPRRVRAGDLPVASPYPAVLSAVAAELQVPLVVIPPLAMGTATGPNEESFIDSIHFSPAGHERMADALAARLAELGYVPGGSGPNVQ
jgi:lysophospholipase L1-like esterase